jgi:hypothetical protein
MILNAGRRFRGVFFDIHCDYGARTLIKSFPKGSDCYVRSDGDTPGAPLIPPSSHPGQRRDRHCFALPAGYVRMVDVDLSTVGADFAARLANSYARVLGQLAGQEVDSRRAPVFCRYSRGFGICEELLTSMKASSEVRDAIRLSRTALDASDSEQRVHGTFSVGNTLVDAEMQHPRFLYDNGAFLGPIEYDIATSLETYVDLIAQRTRKGLESAQLAAFVRALLDHLESALPVDRSLLRALTLYQYIGHLNLFQKLRSKSGASALPPAYFFQCTSNFVKSMSGLL